MSKGATYPVLETVATGMCVLDRMRSKVRGGPDEKHGQSGNEWKGIWSAGSQGQWQKFESTTSALLEVGQEKVAHSISAVQPPYASYLRPAISRRCWPGAQHVFPGTLCVREASS